MQKDFLRIFVCFRQTKQSYFLIRIWTGNKPVLPYFQKFCKTNAEVNVKLEFTKITSKILEVWNPCSKIIKYFEYFQKWQRTLKLKTNVLIKKWTFQYIFSLKSSILSLLKAKNMIIFCNYFCFVFAKYKTSPFLQY